MRTRAWPGASRAEAGRTPAVRDSAAGQPQTSGGRERWAALLTAIVLLLCAADQRSNGSVSSNVNSVQMIVSPHRPVPAPAWVHVRVHTRRTQRVVRCSPARAPVVRRRMTLATACSRFVARLEAKQGHFNDTPTSRCKWQSHAKDQFTRCLASRSTRPRSAAVRAHVCVARRIASRGGQDARRSRFCGRTAADERRLRAPGHAINGNRAVAPGHRLRAPGRAIHTNRAVALSQRSPVPGARGSRSCVCSEPPTACAGPNLRRQSCACFTSLHGNARTTSVTSWWRQRR